MLECGLCIHVCACICDMYSKLTIGVRMSLYYDY